MNNHASSVNCTHETAWGWSLPRIEEAIEKLEKITNGRVCFPRKEELKEVISLLREELASRPDATGKKTTSETDKNNSH